MLRPADCKLEQPPFWVVQLRLVNVGVRVRRGSDATGALFRPLFKHQDANNAVASTEALSSVAKATTADAVYKPVRAYSGALGFEVGAHSLRATAATNALDHLADIAKVH